MNRYWIYMAVLMLLMGKSTLGVAETKTYKVSVTLPASVSLIQESSDRRSSTQLARVNRHADTFIEEIERGSQRFMLKTTVMR